VKIRLSAAVLDSIGFSFVLLQHPALSSVGCTYRKSHGIMSSVPQAKMFASTVPPSWADYRNVTVRHGSSGPRALRTSEKNGNRSEVYEPGKLGLSRSENEMFSTAHRSSSTRGGFRTDAVVSSISRPAFARRVGISSKMVEIRALQSGWVDRCSEPKAAEASRITQQYLNSYATSWELLIVILWRLPKEWESVRLNTIM